MYMKFINEQLEMSTHRRYLTSDYIYRANREYDQCKKKDLDARYMAICDATDYIRIGIAGRHYITNLIRNDYESDEFYKAAFSSFKHEGAFFRWNPDARFWDIIFSPLAENETAYKIWIKFPDESNLMWFTIDKYDPRRGFELTPNPRLMGSWKKFRQFKGVFEDVIKTHPKTIQHILDEMPRIFEREGIVRPSDSDFYSDRSFICYPPYKKKYGDNDTYKIDSYTGDLDYPLR